jgi:chromosomal replication initiation ATPase DnaA
MDAREMMSMRQQDLDYQHFVCDMHPELEQLRPSIRFFKMKSPVEDIVAEPEFDDYPLIASTMKEAARRTAIKYKITVNELTGDCRSKRYTPPRTEFVTFCRVQLGKTYPQIARFMNNRDHTSIMNYTKGALRRNAA